MLGLESFDTTDLPREMRADCCFFLLGVLTFAWAQLMQTLLALADALPGFISGEVRIDHAAKVRCSHSTDEDEDLPFEPTMSVNLALRASTAMQARSGYSIARSKICSRATARSLGDRCNQPSFSKAQTSSSVALLMSLDWPLSAAFITAQPAWRQCGLFKYPAGKSRVIVRLASSNVPIARRGPLFGVIGNARSQPQDIQA